MQPNPLRLPENEFWPLPAPGSSVEMFRMFNNHNKALLVKKDRKQSRLPFKPLTPEERAWEDMKKLTERYLKSKPIRLDEPAPLPEPAAQYMGWEFETYPFNSEEQTFLEKLCNDLDNLPFEPINIL